MEFSEGFAPVFLDGKAFYIDKKGTDVFKKTFKSVSSFSYGVAMCAGEDGKRGFIDAKGNMVVPLILDAAFPFGDSLTCGLILLTSSLLPTTHYRWGFQQSGWMERFA
jgi:hypothetical protein